MPHLGMVGLSHRIKIGGANALPSPPASILNYIFITDINKAKKPPIIFKHYTSRDRTAQVKGCSLTLFPVVCIITVGQVGIGNIPHGEDGDQ